jgi:hypothetical protein
MKFLDNFGRDKLFLFFLIVVIFLGIFIRLNDFSGVSYWTDDMTTLPTGLLSFYPHSFFPGLAGQGEPILGNLIIASGCLLSGEDFSGVSEIRPMFYPGRELLIGAQLINAFPYCHIPMYIFGILFFLLISILSLILLNKYSSLFAISFYAFYPELLKFSRWIHVDVFGYVFATTGIILLWFAYSSEKTRKEFWLFIFAFIFFALSFTTKLPNGIFLVFASFILLEKYRKEILQIVRKLGSKLHLDIVKKIELNESLNYFRPVKIFLFSIPLYFLTFLIPFNLKPQNFFDIVNRYQSVNTEYTSFSFNLDLIPTISRFFLSINVIDMVLIIFSLYVLVRLVLTKKTLNEKFILYSFLFSIFTLLFVQSVIYLRILIIFFFGIILLTSLAFSTKDYSVFKLFRIKKKRLFFSIFFIIYVAFAFSHALAVTPHFESKNHLLCNFSDLGCQLNAFSYFPKETLDYLKPRLKEDEIFISQGSPMIYYYFNRGQHLQEFLFEQEFIKQIGRYPNLIERANYFQPDGKTVRYVLINPFDDVRRQEDTSITDIKRNFEPNHKIISKGNEFVWIYDLENLIER